MLGPLQLHFGGKGPCDRSAAQVINVMNNCEATSNSYIDNGSSFNNNGSTN